MIKGNEDVSIQTKFKGSRPKVIQKRFGPLYLSSQTINGHSEMILVAIVLCINEIPKYRYQKEAVFSLICRDF